MLLWLPEKYTFRCTMGRTFLACKQVGAWASAAAASGMVGDGKIAADMKRFWHMPGLEPGTLAN